MLINFLSKSFLFTPVAPRLKTKALLLMNADRCKGIAEALGFADVLSNLLRYEGMLPLFYRGVLA
jgi:hypothetical protein